MPEAKHTPGPWEAVVHYPDKHGIIRQPGYEIHTPSYDVVAHMPARPPIRKEADAWLIAAAPVLLTELKASSELIRALLDLEMIQDAQMRTLAEQVLRQGDTAIAKAEGTEQ